jgi:type IV pilus assembly protein PilA
MNKTNKDNKEGFTLIELLVVIAIIGILSSVVLASLNTARTKGQDASVKSNLDSVRTQAGVYWDTNKSYNPIGASIAGTDCGASASQPANTMLADQNIARALSATKSVSGAALYCNLKTDGQEYAIAARLPSGGWWCTDSVASAQSGNANPYVGTTAIAGSNPPLSSNSDYTCN